MKRHQYGFSYPFDDLDALRNTPLLAIPGGADAPENGATVMKSKRVDVSDDPIGEITADTAEHFDHDHHAKLQALRKMIRN